MGSSVGFVDGIVWTGLKESPSLYVEIKVEEESVVQCTEVIE
jgi:hypothetical protein